MSNPRRLLIFMIYLFVISISNAVQTHEEKVAEQERLQDEAYKKFLEEIEQGIRFKTEKYVRGVDCVTPVRMLYDGTCAKECERWDQEILDELGHCIRKCPIGQSYKQYSHACTLGCPEGYSFAPNGFCVIGCPKGYVLNGEWKCI